MTNLLIGRPVLLLVIALVATAPQAARAAGSSGVAGSSGLARPSSASSGSLACDSLSCWHEEEVERYRKSFFQGAEVLDGYLGDTGDAAGGLDQSFSEVRASFGIPLGSLDNVIGLRPFFRADFLDGPTAVDLPETLYNTGISILHQAKWSERYSTTVILTPAVRSDFTTSEKAFRLFGLAVVNWKARHDLTLSAGVVYFDRADFSLLPAVGLTWTPTPTMTGSVTHRRCYTEPGPTWRTPTATD